MLPEQPPPNPAPLEARLRILKSLCFLTFIGSGLGAISYGTIGLFHTLFSSLSITTFSEEQQEAIRLLLSAGRWFFILNALLYSLSFTGAYMMWKLRKAGFHYYTISQIIILISPLAFIRGFQMPWFSVAITGLYVLAYSSYFKLFR